MNDKREQVMDAAPKGLEAYHRARYERMGQHQKQGSTPCAGGHLWIRDDEPGWRCWWCASCSYRFAIPA